MANLLYILGDSYLMTTDTSIVLSHVKHQSMYNSNCELNIKYELITMATAFNYKWGYLICMLFLSN